MTARIIDGKKIAAELLEDLKIEVANLIVQYNVIPSIKIIQVVENAASELYIKNKKKKAFEVGIEIEVLNFDSFITKQELKKAVNELNADTKVHAILIQSPLPKHFNPREIFNFISPEKDVDCFTDINLGKLFAGNLNLMPCTPRGILTMLQREKIVLEGMNALVIGCSNIVGNPMAQVLLRQNCTVTIAHSKTKNLHELCMKNELIVVAAGCQNLVNKVQKDAIVIDVGINCLKNGRLVGDCNFETLLQIASAITTVPGGVGPMTVLSLMQNTVDLYKTINIL